MLLQAEELISTNVNLVNGIMDQGMRDVWFLLFVRIAVKMWVLVGRLQNCCFLDRFDGPPTLQP